MEPAVLIYKNNGWAGKSDPVAAASNRYWLELFEAFPGLSLLHITQSKGFFMKILVSYDGSEIGEKVVEVAVRRAKESGAYVYLVHSKVGPDVTKDNIAEIERELDYLIEGKFKKNGIEAEPHLLIRGLNPGEDVVEYAREKGVDEIILGIRKRSKVEKLVFGSTAQYIILEAHCPVLTVK